MMLGGPRLPQTKLKPVSGTTPSVDIQVLRQHLVELKQEGFTIFRDFLPRDVVGQLRQFLDPEFDGRIFADKPAVPERRKIGGAGRGSGEAGLLDTDVPRELSQICVDELLCRKPLLDFAELLLGTCQLDSLQLSGLPPGPPHLVGRVGTSGWHRDGVNTHGNGLWWRWGAVDAADDQQPRGKNKYEKRPYTTPLGANFLVYLQDMTLESGPLRLVRRSHVESIPTPAPDDPAKYEVLQGEEMLTARSGDLVVLHCDVLHATTYNTDRASGRIRYFISAYLTRHGLPHRDNFDTPRVAAVVAAAIAQGDKRLARLFGGHDAVEAEEEAHRIERILAHQRFGAARM